MELTRETAEKLAKDYINNDELQTLIVTSDGGVYIDNEVSAMEKHCFDNRLEMIVLRGSKHDHPRDNYVEVPVIATDENGSVITEEDAEETKTTKVKHHKK